MARSGGATRALQRLPSCPAIALISGRAMRMQALGCSLGNAAITPGGTTAATSSPVTEQAGWAAGVDGRRNGQGCPGWRGWLSRWRRSRSICGASRRQGRHRAQARGRNTILLKTFGDLLWTTAAKLQVFEMAMAEQTLLSESGGSPIGTKRVAYREAIEAARSKTVADTSGRAERASGSKRARRG